MEAIQLGFTVARGAPKGVLELDVYGVVGARWDGNSAKDVRDAIKKSDAKTIRVRIHSHGGSADDGLAIYQLLQEHDAHVEVTIDHTAASAGTVIAMAGDEIKMAEHGQFMIHEARFPLLFDADLRKIEIAKKRLEQQNQAVAELYAARTGLSTEAVRELMRAETWFTAKQAKERGFVTAIVPGKKKPADKKSRASAEAAAVMSAALELYPDAPDWVRADLEADVSASVEPTPTEPEPQPPAAPAGVPATPPAGTDNTEKEQAPMANSEKNELKLIASACGLDPEASAADIVAACHTGFDQLANLCANIGEQSFDAARGALKALKTKAQKSDELQAKLDEVEADKERVESDTILQELKNEKRISPADERDWKAGKDEFATLAGKRAFARAAKAGKPAYGKSENRPPEASGDNQAEPTDGKPRWNGKTFAELKGDERAQLIAEDRGLYEEMRRAR